MSIIKDYWSKWLAGETTGKEVDAYIQSSFAHLVSEYRSVYFVKCVCKENPYTADIDTNEAADAKEQNQEHVQAEGIGSVKESLTGLQSEPIQQSGTGDNITVEEQNQDQDQVNGAAADAQKSQEIDPMLSDCVCLQSPELRALLQDFDQGDFDEGKKNLSWDDCALLEVSIIRLLDNNRLKTKLAMLEVRYEAVVDPKKYERYRQSVIRVSGDDADLKERINFLVWDLYWAYTTAGKVGQLRQRAVKPILGILPIIILFFLGCLMIYLRDSFSMDTIGLTNSIDKNVVFSTFMIVLSVVFFGAFGALISFQRRMSKLEVRGETFSNYLQLCSLGNEGPLALFAGGFFALLLLILFGSGLANAAVSAIFSAELTKLVVPLFPQLYVEKNASTGILTLAKAITNLNFIGYASIAKLLVWSFLAGFAEALIPDAMTRLIEKAKLMEKQ